jgi:hypothetical protein
VYKRQEDFHLQFSKVYDSNVELLTHLMDLDSLSTRLQVLHDLNNLIVSNEDIDMNTIKRTAKALQTSTSDVIAIVQNKLTSWLPSSRFFYACLIVVTAIATCMLVLIICLRCRRPSMRNQSEACHKSIETPLHVTRPADLEATTSDAPPSTSTFEPAGSPAITTIVTEKSTTNPTKRKLHEEIIRFQDLLKDDF